MKRMITGVALVGVVGSAVAAETTRWVERTKADVRAGRGSYFDVVNTVMKGERLVVLKGEARWLFVRTPKAKEGWIFEVALAAQPVTADSVFSEFVPGDSATSATAASAGGKGVYAQTYARNKGFDYGVVQWIERNQGIAADDVERFSRDGELKTAGGAP